MAICPILAVSKLDTVTRCQHASSTVYWQSADHHIRLWCCRISITQFLTYTPLLDCRCISCNALVSSTKKIFSSNTKPENADQYSLCPYKGWRELQPGSQTDRMFTFQYFFSIVALIVDQVNQAILIWSWETIDRHTTHITHIT